jgi:NAD(P)-dependent dehydrogenase (short-subunit alcohol dehydrogenase family)
VIGLTKSVAIDYVKQGIRCNAICPGTVESPSLHDRLRATGDELQAMKDFVARQPMGRIGTAKKSQPLQFIWDQMKVPSQPPQHRSLMAAGQTNRRRPKH